MCQQTRILDSIQQLQAQNEAMVDYYRSLKIRTPFDTATLARQSVRNMRRMQLLQKRLYNLTKKGKL